MVFSVIVCILTGYFIGSLSISYLIAGLRGYDPSRDGSGNPGASNTLILAGKGLGILNAVADILKAFAAWKLCAYLFPDLRVAGQITGVCAVFGHMFPVWYRFRGGKGLACLGGMVLAHSPWSFLTLLAVAILICVVTNYICIMTSAMSVVFPVYYLIVDKDPLGALILFLPAIPMILKHRVNFRRIKEGTELRLSFLFRKDQELKRIGLDSEGNLLRHEEKTE